MNCDWSDELVACLVDYMLGIDVGWTWIIMQACEYDIWSMIQVEYMWIMEVCFIFEYQGSMKLISKAYVCLKEL